jgi:hypothetical protein
MQTIPESNAASLPGRPWNKGKFIGQKTTVTAEARLGNSHAAAARQGKEGLGSLQPRDRQQAAGMRPGKLDGGGHRAPRLCD